MQLRVSTQTHCFHVDNIPSISYPCVNWLQKLGNAERIRTSYTARMTIKGIWVTENSTIYGTVGFNYSSWQRSSAEWKKRHLCSLRGERSHERLVIRRTRRETGRAIIFFLRHDYRRLRVCDWIGPSSELYSHFLLYLHRRPIFNDLILLQTIRETKRETNEKQKGARRR